MKISAIRQQQKQKNRYSVYVDAVYAFSLSEDALLESGIVPGIEIDTRQLKAYKQLSADDKIQASTFRYAAQRPHSEWELRQYLRRKEASEPVTEKIVAKLIRIGLINDESFAKLWVENRRLLKPVSRRKLALELKQKHIEHALIDTVLKGDDQVTDERVVLHQLILKKQGRYADRQKLMQYLARQGFGFDDIKTVLSEIDSETES